MISGFEADVAESLEEVRFKAAQVLAGPDQGVVLLAKPTGRRIKGLAWWEIEKQ
jgi:hypothetical protein